MIEGHGPAQYIQPALESVGLGVLSVDVTDYRPDVFGNFVALVMTDSGLMRVVYDRQFELETGGLIDALTEQRLINALEDHQTAFYG